MISGRITPGMLGLAACLAFGGCNQTSGPAGPAPGPVASNITAPDFRLPEGSGCAGEVSRTRAVIDNDLATGNVNRKVHDRFAADLDRAASACAAGKDGEAVRMVEATKARFGYR